MTSLAVGLGKTTCTPPGRVRAWTSARSPLRSRARAGASAAGSITTTLRDTSGHQLPHRLVPDLEQLLAGQGVLVLLDALQQELVVLLLERARRPPRRTGLVLAGQA